MHIVLPARLNDTIFAPTSFDSRPKLADCEREDVEACVWRESLGTAKALMH